MMYNFKAFLVSLIIGSLVPPLLSEEPGADYRHRAFSSVNNDFSGKNLAGADFSHSVITNANFEKSVLRKTLLKYVSGSDSSFKGADLRDSVLRYSVFASTKFTGADCRKADFTYCLLADADFTGADLRGADFRYASLSLANRFDAKTVYDETTRFPDDFDPKRKGLTLKQGKE